MSSSTLNIINDVKAFKQAGLSFTGRESRMTKHGEAWRLTLKRGKAKVAEASNEGGGGPSVLKVFSQADLDWLVQESGLIQRKSSRWDGPKVQLNEDHIASVLGEYDENFQILKSLSTKAKTQIIGVPKDGGEDGSCYRAKCAPTAANIATFEKANPQLMVVNELLAELFPARVPSKSPSFGM